MSGEMVSAEKSFVILSPNTSSRVVLSWVTRRVVNKQELGTYFGCPMEIVGRSLMKFDFIFDRVLSKISSSSSIVSLR